MSSTGSKFFNPDYGLMAGKAAAAVADMGPLMADQDGRFWTYANGVWSVDAREVGRRTVRLLGERYRPHHLKALVDVLIAEVPEFEIRPTPEVINFRNGMLRWGHDTQPALIEHHEEFMSTVQLPVNWNTEAACGPFDDFLESAIPEDDRQRVWEIIGYLMMSGNPLQRLFLLSGGGGNGKGVLLEVIKALLGPHNISAVQLREFGESQFATAELFGKLANICGDIDAAYIENTGRIKELSGDDYMKAERKYGQPFHFKFWGKALFSANGLPASSDPSRGWVRRWEVVHFPNEPAKPVLGLGSILSEPRILEGIAVRAVYALRDLMERRTFERGESAVGVHKEFAHRSNKVLMWIDEVCRRDAAQWYERQEILRSFRAWDNMQNPGSRQMNASTFYELVRKVPGVVDAKRRGQNGFKGIVLPNYAQPWAEPDDDLPPIPREAAQEPPEQGKLV